MSPLLVALAAGVTAGAVVALAARDGRIAVLGATVALVLAPLVADPIPEPALLTVRVLGALLAGYLLWIGLRDATPLTRGPAFGTATLGLAAVAGFVAGVAGHGLAANPTGPAAAQGAATAVIVLALIPVIRAREAFRLALGILLLLLGVTLLRVGLSGSPDALESIATVGALALVAAAGIAVATLVYADVGDFEFRAPEPVPVRRRPGDEAHRFASEPTTGSDTAASTKMQHGSDAAAVEADGTVDAGGAGGPVEASRLQREADPGRDLGPTGKAAEGNWAGATARRRRRAQAAGAGPAHETSAPPTPDAPPPTPDAPPPTPDAPSDDAPVDLPADEHGHQA